MEGRQAGYFIMHFLGIATAAVALSTTAMVAFPSVSTGQTPTPMGGGYTNVIPIPVNDPAVKAIAGALIKPAGAGPFPGVIYMSGCGGLNYPADRVQQKVAIDHLLSKGVATLVVDPFTPRNEPEGVCANLDEKRAAQYFSRGGNDALAALKVLEAMPDIDQKHIFLMVYSFGAISSLSAIDTKNPASHDAKVAGVIAYYPYCWDGVDPSVPVLVMIGEKDDWTPAAKCQAVTGNADFEVIVYPGDTHAFTTPFEKPLDYLGHHMVYDEKATQDAQQRADAFMAAHMK
jgi:dienelactone hydrolase